MNKTYITYAVLIVVIVAGLIVARNAKTVEEGKYDEFAQCIADTNTIFYGAFWCSHCAEQKSFFGSAQKYLPYVECSIPDKTKQLQVCIDADVTSYPTWDFPDNSRKTGTLQLGELAEKTGCQLPE